MSTPPSKLADRIDKWLWAVRVFKSRPLATEACKTGCVTLGDTELKPARDVRVGEQLQVRQGLVLRTLKVKGIPKSRVGAPLVADFCEELTPDSEWAKAREQRVQNLLAREKGSGRPTKKDRREMERFFDV